MLTSKSLHTPAVVRKDYLIRSVVREKTNKPPYLVLVYLGDRGQTCFLWSVRPCCYFEGAIPVSLLKELHQLASSGHWSLAGALGWSLVTPCCGFPGLSKLKDP